VVDSKIEKLVEDINELDVKGELVSLSEAEVENRKDYFGELWHLLKSKESVLLQRSRTRWLREGDLNSAYFHACVKSRGNRNFLNALKVDGRWVESPVQIRQAVVAHFTNLFSSPPWSRPNLDGIVFPTISEVDNCNLIRIFSLEEVQLVVSDCDGNKSPGPGGFNFSFIKSFWNLLKGEISTLFDQFHVNANLPKSFSSFFVALIPKVQSPFEINDYRPISLVGCLYKLIAKVLATRLAEVLNPIVASTQSAFLKGRLLVDGVLVVNEVVDLAKKSGSSCLIFKVDFEKAYDSVEWSFLDYMLGRFGFSDKWRAWIRACVFAGNMSILVNGSTTTEINIQRGLKQGDPLAPFLFILVAEGLGGLMKKAVELNRFKGFKVGSNEVVVSHLQYADDTLCIGEASFANLWSLKAILRAFELVSGLKVNFWKSCVMGINVSNDFIRLASLFLNSKIGSVPFKYLGLPVGANPRRASTWEPMVTALRKRLEAWGNNYVSLGGRIILLNAVLNAIPIFFLSFMKILVAVWKKVRRIQRDFLWGCRGGRKRISWVKWDTVCKPKKLGGLGVRDVRAVNISLLAKWRWRLLEDDQVMWKEVLKGKYSDAVIGSVIIGENCKPWFSSVWWKDICSVGVNLDSNWFAQGVKKVLGNGNQTAFWSDIWLGSAPLQTVFPRLYSIVIQKDSSVADMRIPLQGEYTWNFEWRRRLFVWEEDLVVQLKEALALVVLSDDRDRWVWVPNSSGAFTVKSTYWYIINLFVPQNLIGMYESQAFVSLWNCRAPSKIQAFGWQLLLDRIPTRQNLLRRSINLVNGDHNYVCVAGLSWKLVYIFSFIVIFLGRFGVWFLIGWGRCSPFLRIFSLF
jgi:hypothetical protein